MARRRGRIMFDFAFIKLGDAYGLLPLNLAALDWLILQRAMTLKLGRGDLAAMTARIQSCGFTVGPV
jgi:hypothetical protein